MDYVEKKYKNEESKDIVETVEITSDQHHWIKYNLVNGLRYMNTNLRNGRFIDVFDMLQCLNKDLIEVFGFKYGSEIDES